MSPRGTTRLGHPSALPLGPYNPALQQGENVVKFVGEDARSRIFDVSTLPLPGWHPSLMKSWSLRIGVSGSLRTLSSVTGAWGTLVRFIRFLAQTPRVPKTPSDLQVWHIDTYLRLRASNTSERGAKTEMRSIALVFDLPPLNQLVSAEVRDRMRPHLADRSTPRSGYSDGELARLVAAARTDVAALRDRISAQALTLDDEYNRRMESARRTGIVEVPGVPASKLYEQKRRVASQLFVTHQDITPLLVLLVALTGWNIEVIKELPAKHRVIEDLAVEVEVIKRRRGSGRWLQNVTWEIGPPGKELNTPGGVYLLLHRLMAPARELLDDPSAFWAVWQPQRTKTGGECHNPFAATLSGGPRHRPWVQAHGINADPAAGKPEKDAALLRLNFNRLKSSIDVRRTRQMGGHLPSAARSNTTGVLFRNYLAGDHSTIEWARDLVAETLVEVEQAAWSAHRRALGIQGVKELDIRTSPLENGTPQDSAKQVGTAWTSCTDHEHHPLTGRRCTASFLDCFHCGNCVVTDDHLPRLLSLLDALEVRRRQINEDLWWSRYGPAWAAIRYEILPKFTQAEVHQAERAKPSDSFLDLVEPRWEQP